MTQATQIATTRVIVAGGDSVFATLAASGVGWDLQHQVRTLAQLRDDMSNGQLDSQSSILVISDSIAAQPGELETLVAWAAPYLQVFVVAWDPEGADALYERIMTLIHTSHEGPGEPAIMGISFVPATTGAAMLDAMRAQLAEDLPWPEEYDSSLHEPLTRQVTAVPAFNPGSIQAPPAPVAHPVTAAVPAAVAAPLTVAPVQAVTTAQVQVDPKPVTWNRRSGDPRSAHGQTVTGTPIPGQVTLAVTSSKGGSGKSTTAMLTAATIAHGSRKAFEAGLVPRPLKVVLVDMDTRDGQVASMIGQYMPTAINIRVEPRWDEATILRNLVHSDRLEIDCLLAPVRPRSADDVGPAFYQHVIRSLQCTHDVVVMDTSVNYLDPLISTVCLPDATAIMFVTTLVATAVQGMARALNEITGDLESDGLGIPAEKIGVVVNCAMSNVGMDKAQVLEAALGVPIIGQVPMASQDVQLATNYNRMHMLMEHTELGPAYFALAQACLPRTHLLPPADWSREQGSASGNTGPVRPTDSQAPQESLAPHQGQTPQQGPAPHQVEPPRAKRGLFHRRANLGARDSGGNR